MERAVRLQTSMSLALLDTDVGEFAAEDGELSFCNDIEHNKFTALCLE
jgi:hypothetical protein